MGLWDFISNLLKKKNDPPRSPQPPVIVEEEPEIVVPEVTVEELQSALAQAEPPFVIDVREPHEWRLVRITQARHLPMNDLPAQVETLPRDRLLVILCAHGSRSYSVAAWLIEQGFKASSLQGGITQWASRGGKVEQGAPR
jgi:rhodanese-related sulfurtransferase